MVTEFHAGERERYDTIRIYPFAKSVDEVRPFDGHIEVMRSDDFDRGAIRINISMDTPMSVHRIALLQGALAQAVALSADQANWRAWRDAAHFA